VSNPLGRPRTDPDVRFWDKVEIRHPRECWEWQSTLSRGYGRMWNDGTQVSAHRYAYMRWHNLGTIAPRLQVMHRCDNRRCVNPFHLELGTARDNIRDKHAKGRAHDQSGERNNSGFRLTAADVDEIRARRAQGESLASLSASFGVSEGHVSVVARGLKRGAK